MKCFQCDHGIEERALLVAMEQREHFATTRHVDACERCALHLYKFIEERAHGSRYRHQSTNCWFCNSAHPFIRMRFDVPHQKSMHTPLCETCYMAMRADLVQISSGLCAFIEKEWQTPGVAHAHRMPWAVASVVHVHTCPAGGRWRGQFGIVIGVRGLVQPWFGYDVRFADGSHHFFHERELDYVAASLQELNELEAVADERPVERDVAPAEVKPPEPTAQRDTQRVVALVEESPAPVADDEFPLPDLSELPPLPDIIVPPSEK